VGRKPETHTVSVAMACRAQTIKESQLIEAAKSIAGMLDDDDRRLGRVLPPASKLQAVAKEVAVAVAKGAYDGAFATALPKPLDLGAAVDAHSYNPKYSQFA
jgi:malic enzyme